MKTKILLASLMLFFFIVVTPSLAQSATPTRRGLSQASLRSCQAREAAVKNRMDSLVRMATNMMQKFDSIATRVKDFYINKVVPSGKTVSNYNSLVTDIDAKKAVVQTDLTAAQSMVNAFACTADDPKGLLTQFRMDIQKVKADLKNYRTAIKNLIVAVHSK